MTVQSTRRPVGIVEIAASLRDRTIGLLGRTGLAEGTGLLLAPCLQIHTWFMRFPIDVVFLDGDNVVVTLHERVGPFRLASGGWRSRKALELPAGTVAQLGLMPGEALGMEAV